MLLFTLLFVAEIEFLYLNLCTLHYYLQLVSGNTGVRKFRYLVTLPCLRKSLHKKDAKNQNEQQKKDGQRTGVSLLYIMISSIIQNSFLFIYRLFRYLSYDHKEKIEDPFHLNIVYGTYIFTIIEGSIFSSITYSVEIYFSFYLLFIL